MKWDNKGHQFDKAGKKWVEIFREKDGIWVFGAGVYGKETRSLLEQYHCFKGFIDNDVHKKDEILDCEICTFEEYKSRQSNAWIVISAEDVHIAEIQKQLENEGKIKNKDFFAFRDFFNQIFPIISIYGFGKLYSWKSEIGVTERCTLKCKKCVRGCGMVDSKQEDISLEKVKASADSYFSNFDYVTEFCLIGGKLCYISNCRRL